MWFYFLYENGTVKIITVLFDMSMQNFNGNSIYFIEQNIR